MGLPIDQTMSALGNESEVPLEILPNGEIRMEGDSPSDTSPKTMTEDIGGEFEHR